MMIQFPELCSGITVKWHKGYNAMMQSSDPYLSYEAELG
jgi:hypothetical protein